MCSKSPETVIASAYYRDHGQVLKCIWWNTECADRSNGF